MTKNIVLYVGSFDFKLGSASSVRVIENALFIKQFGFDVQIMGVVHNEFEVDTIQIHDIANQAIPFDTSIESIKNKFVDLKVSYENIIIIAYNYPPVAFHKLIKFTKKNEIFLVADVTEWYSFQGKFNIYNVLRWGLNEWKMCFLLDKCDHFILATSFLQKRFENKNTVILPFVTTKEKIQILENEKNDVVIYTYAGSPGLNFKKDRLDILMKAFLKLKEKSDKFIFNVIGVEKNFFSDKSILRIIELLGEAIKFHGRLPHERTVEIIKKSDYTVFARDVNRLTKVGFPTKVFEAFKYNIPVITNNTSDLSDYITTENGVLLEDNTVKAFENAFLKINTDITIKSMHKENMMKSNPFGSENFENEFRIFLDNILSSGSRVF